MTIAPMWQVQWPQEWPGVPEPMSFSTMRAIETCPLRWSLSRATYGAIWGGKGYPDRAYTGTLAGQVVHQALERITKEIGVAGKGTQPSLVNTVKALGGYSCILERESDRVAATT